MDKGAIVVISGCPGTGKSTVAAQLADQRQNGFLLSADDYYEFIQHPIDPTDPASRDQNETVTRAAAGTARTFAEGGYAVFLDAVIGPWLLATFLEPLSGFRFEAHYLVLRASLETTLSRAMTRPEDGKIAAAGIRQMHRRFADLGLCERHAIETNGLQVSDTVEQVEAVIAAGSHVLPDLA